MRGTRGWVLVVLAWVMAGCGDDDAGGVGQCTEEALAAACPAGTTPMADDASKAQCQSKSQYAPILGADGLSVTGVCSGGELRCQSLCGLSTPCECGVEAASAQGVTCAKCPAVCGDGVCEEDEGESSVTCNSDCKDPCAFGEQRCVDTVRQRCEDGAFVNDLCAGSDVCKPLEEGKACERSTECAQGQTCARGSALLLGRCGGPATACISTTCAPTCDGKTCGDDGCGGQCGVCADGERCTAAGVCVEATSALGFVHLQYDLPRMDVTLITGELMWAGLTYPSARDFVAVELQTPVIATRQANTEQPGSGEVIRTGGIPTTLTPGAYQVVFQYDGRFYMLSMRDDAGMPSAPQAEVQLVTTRPFADGFTFTLGGAAITATTLSPSPLALPDKQGASITGDTSVTLIGTRAGSGEAITCPLTVPAGHVGTATLIGDLAAENPVLGPKVAVLTRTPASNRLLLTTFDCVVSVP